MRRGSRYGQWRRRRGDFQPVDAAAAWQLGGRGNVDREAARVAGEVVDRRVGPRRRDRRRDGARGSGSDDRLDVLLRTGRKVDLD